MVDVSAVLLQDGVLTKDGLARAQAAARDGDLCAAALALGLATEGRLLHALCKARGVPGIDLSRSAVPARSLDGLSQPWCRDRRLLPIAVGRGELVLAMADPDDQQAADEVRYVTGKKVLCYLALRPSVLDGLAALAAAREAGLPAVHGERAPELPDPGAAWVEVVHPSDRAPDEGGDAARVELVPIAADPSAGTPFERGPAPSRGGGAGAGTVVRAGTAQVAGSDRLGAAGAAARASAATGAGPAGRAGAAPKATGAAGPSDTGVPGAGAGAGARASLTQAAGVDRYGAAGAGAARASTAQGPLGAGGVGATDVSAAAGADRGREPGALGAGGAAAAGRASAAAGAGAGMGPGEPGVSGMAGAGAGARAGVAAGASGAAVSGDSAGAAGGGPDVAAPGAHGAAGKPDEQLGQGKRVLVADDDAEVRGLLARIARSLGCAVVEAGDGRAALERVRADRPDVVLLDAMMPQLHGFEVCRAIKGDPDLRGTRVILCSAVYRGTVGADAKVAFGADDFVEKPFRLEVMLRALKVALVGSARAESPEEKAAREEAARLWRAGAASCVQGRLDEGVALCRLATEKDPLSAEAHFYLGHALSRRESWFEAAAAYERAAELRPDVDAAHQHLAQIYERLGFQKSARQAWQRAIETCRDDRRKKAMQARLIQLIGMA